MIMTEENLVAIKWLIASLESRIVDLTAGKLDECLEDLAKFPIPVQYRSLCHELKFTFPCIPLLSEISNTHSVPPFFKEAVGNDTCSDSESVLLNAHSSTGSCITVKVKGTFDRIGKLSGMPFSGAPVSACRLSPDAGYVDRKRKLSIGDSVPTDDAKKRLFDTKSAENGDTIVKNSPVKIRKGIVLGLPDANPYLEKSITCSLPVPKEITSQATTQLTILSPVRASTRPSRGSSVHTNEEEPLTALNSSVVNNASGGKNSNKDKAEEDENQPSRRSRRTKS